MTTAALRAYLLDLLQQLLFEVEFIVTRFDDPVGVGHRLQQALADSHLVQRRLGDAGLGPSQPNQRLYPITDFLFGTRQSAGVRVENRHGPAGADRESRPPAADLGGTDDRDSRCFESVHGYLRITLDLTAAKESKGQFVR